MLVLENFVLKYYKSKYTLVNMGIVYLIIRMAKLIKTIMSLTFILVHSDFSICRKKKLYPNTR